MMGVWVGSGGFKRWKVSVYQNGGFNIYFTFALFSIYLMK